MNAPSHTARQLARDVGRLFPDWRDPERYFENRSELEWRLKKLAKELEKLNG